MLKRNNLNKRQKNLVKYDSPSNIPEADYKGFQKNKETKPKISEKRTSIKSEASKYHSNSALTETERRILNTEVSLHKNTAIVSKNDCDNSQKSKISTKAESDMSVTNLKNVSSTNVPIKAESKPCKQPERSKIPTNKVSRNFKVDARIKPKETEGKSGTNRLAEKKYGYLTSNSMSPSHMNIHESSFNNKSINTSRIPSLRKSKPTEAPGLKKVISKRSQSDTNLPRFSASQGNIASKLNNCNNLPISLRGKSVALEILSLAENLKQTSLDSDNDMYMQNHLIDISETLQTLSLAQNLKQTSIESDNDLYTQNHLIDKPVTLEIPSLAQNLKQTPIASDNDVCAQNRLIDKYVVELNRIRSEVKRFQEISTEPRINDINEKNTDEFETRDFLDLNIPTESFAEQGSSASSESLRNIENVASPSSDSLEVDDLDENNYSDFDDEAPLMGITGEMESNSLQPTPAPRSTKSPRNGLSRIPVLDRFVKRNENLDNLAREIFGEETSLTSETKNIMSDKGVSDFAYQSAKETHNKPRKSLSCKVKNAYSSTTEFYPCSPKHHNTKPNTHACSEVPDTSQQNANANRPTAYFSGIRSQTSSSNENINTSAVYASTMSSQSSPAYKDTNSLMACTSMGAQSSPACKDTNSLISCTNMGAQSSPVCKDTNSLMACTSIGAQSSPACKDTNSLMACTSMGAQSSPSCKDTNSLMVCTSMGAQSSPACKDTNSLMVCTSMGAHSSPACKDTNSLMACTIMGTQSSSACNISCASTPNENAGKLAACQYFDSIERENIYFSPIETEENFFKNKFSERIKKAESFGTLEAERIASDSGAGANVPSGNSDILNLEYASKSFRSKIKTPENYSFRKFHPFPPKNSITDEINRKLEVYSKYFLKQILENQRNAPRVSGNKERKLRIHCVKTESLQNHDYSEIKNIILNNARQCRSNENGQSKATSKDIKNSVESFEYIKQNNPCFKDAYIVSRIPRSEKSSNTSRKQDNYSNSDLMQFGVIEETQRAENKPRHIDGMLLNNQLLNTTPLETEIRTLTKENSNLMESSSRNTAFPGSPNLEEIRRFLATEHHGGKIKITTPDNLDNLHRGHNGYEENEDTNLIKFTDWDLAYANFLEDYNRNLSDSRSTEEIDKLLIEDIGVEEQTYFDADHMDGLSEDGLQSPRRYYRLQRVSEVSVTKDTESNRMFSKIVISFLLLVLITLIIIIFKETVL